MAVVLLATTFIAVAQLMALAAGQQRDNQWRTLAMREAANALERIAAQPYQQLTNEALADWKLPPAAAARLPAARLRVEVREVEQPLPAKQIRVAVDWTNAAGMRVEPLSLVTWRHRGEQAE